MIADTTSLLTKHAKAMSLIYHDRAVVLMLQLYDLWQVSQIALHREHAIHNDELDCILRKLTEHALQIFHIIVFVVKLGSE